MTEHIDSDYTISLYKVVTSSLDITSVKTITTTTDEETTTERTRYFATQSLNTPDGHVGPSGQAQNVGTSVTIVNSSKILVGAPTRRIPGFSNNNPGAIIEYTHTEGVTGSGGSQWVQTVILSGNTDLMLDSNYSVRAFGFSLDSYNNYVAVGAPAHKGPDPDQASNQGTVTIYRSSSLSGYTLEETLRPTGSHLASRYFGAQVRFNLKSNKLAVNEQVNNGEKEVFIYSSGSDSGWYREANFSSSLLVSSTYNGFGHCLAFSGAYLAVGAPLDSITSPTSIAGAGKVCIFKSSSSGWSEIGIFSSSTAAVNSYYGNSVSLLPDKRLVVGEPQGHPGTLKTGSIEIFSFDDSGNKTLIQTIANPRDENKGYFGRNVDSTLDGKFIVVSRPGGTDAGLVASGYTDGHAALFVYESGSSGTWALSGTLTRDLGPDGTPAGDIGNIDYYGNNPGGWIGSSMNTDYEDTGHIHSDIVKIKDGVILLGVAGAADNPSYSTTNYGYSRGEFRTWRSVVTSSTETTSTTTTTSATIQSQFLPFRFSHKGPLNIQNQSTAKGYKTFLGEPKT
tara:strand:- start:4486 stop:6177 length:1692 start_codon:yes stop_codon:yes gene_type:complete